MNILTSHQHFTNTVVSRKQLVWELQDDISVFWLYAAPPHAGQALLGLLSQHLSLHHKHLP